MSRTIIIALFLAFCTTLHAGYVEQVNAFYVKMQETMGNAEYQQKAYFEYSHKINQRESGTTIPEATVKIYRTGKKMHIDMGYAELWKDANEFVFAVHTNKTLNWGTNPNSAQSDMVTINIKNTLEFQKLLFANPASVKEIPLNETTVKITLVPAKEITDNFKVQDVVFLYDTKSKNVKKMTMNYTLAHKYASQVVTYHEINYNAQFTILDKNPIRKIISEQGVVLDARFKTYTINKTGTNTKK